MVERLQDTDAYIMQSFMNKVGHLKGKSKTPEYAVEMKRLGTPFVQKLVAKGHTLQEAVSLLASALNS